MEAIVQRDVTAPLVCAPNDCSHRQISLLDIETAISRGMNRKDRSAA